jgi:predicted DNA-binding transcriptional regulator AlpA
MTVAHDEHGTSVPVDDIISIPEAARRIGVCAESLYRLSRAGKFPPAIRIGSRVIVSVPKLERFLHGDASLSTEGSGS